MIEKRKGAKGFSYRVRVEKFGHIVATRTFRRKSDAVAYEREVLSRLDRGLSAIDERAGTRPVSQWCTEWLAAYKPGAPATRKRTESLVRVWVLPHFGAMSLNSVSRLAVRTEASWV